MQARKNAAAPVVRQSQLTCSQNIKEKRMDDKNAAKHAPRAIMRQMLKPFVQEYEPIKKEILR